MKKFIVFADERYKDLLVVLLDSLKAFSKSPVHVVCCNFKLHRHFNGYNVDEVEMDTTLKVHGVSMGRFDYIVANKICDAILLDADCVANWNVDELLNVLDDPRPIQHLSPVAVCGSLNEQTKEWFDAPADYVYANAVPMVIFPGVLDFLKELLRWRKTFQLVHEKLQCHGALIDDEVAINYLRLMKPKGHYMSCSAPDCAMFKFYMDDSRVESNGLNYYGQYITWHLFHGEKDPEAARSMLNDLIKAGPKFLYDNPFRNRVPVVYES